MCPFTFKVRVREISQAILVILKTWLNMQQCVRIEKVQEGHGKLVKCCG